MNRFVVGDMTGQSMRPTLKPGDVLLVERDPGRLRVGDLVVFGAVVHRLVWIDPYEHLWECGDNPGGLPRRRVKEEVTGRVKAIVRDGVFVDPPRPPRTMLVGLMKAALWRWTGWPGTTSNQPRGSWREPSGMLNGKGTSAQFSFGRLNDAIAAAGAAADMCGICQTPKARWRPGRRLS